jgi:hypothetical protein
MTDTKKHGVVNAKGEQIARRHTPEELERAHVLQAQIIDILNRSGVTFEEGFSCLIWIIANALYDHNLNLPVAEWPAHLGERIAYALRQIEQEKQRGVVPLG